MAYEMRISDWSSDVCSSYLLVGIDDHLDEIGVAVERIGRRKAPEIARGEPVERGAIDLAQILDRADEEFGHAVDDERGDDAERADGKLRRGEDIIVAQRPRVRTSTRLNSRH